MTAVVFADLVDSTGLYERVGESDKYQLISLDVAS